MSPETKKTLTAAVITFAVIVIAIPVGNQLSKKVDGWMKG